MDGGFNGLNRVDGGLKGIQLKSCFILFHGLHICLTISAYIYNYIELDYVEVVDCIIFSIHCPCKYTDSVF